MLTQTAPDAPLAAPPATARAMAATAGATFLAFLDVTVVNLAFPDLARSFSAAPLTELAWVITAYSVALAALLAAAGRAADVIGRRTAFISGVVVFGVASALAAAAPTLGLLIAARALQGAGAAVMIPASLGLLLMHTPLERRAKAIAAWGAAGAFAAAVGPSLGGVLVQAAGWRSVFLINLPVVVLIAVMALRIPADGSRNGELPERSGTLALAGGIGLVVLAISKGADWGWGSTGTIGSLVVGVLLLLTAVRLSNSAVVPVLEVSLWRDRQFAATNAVNLLYGVVLFAWMLLGVIFLTQVWHYSELRAGFAMSPGAIGATVGALAGGGLVERYGQRIVTVVGALAMGVVGIALLNAIPANPAFLTVWLPAGLISGAGMGLVTTALSSAAAVTVPPQHFAAGLGMNMTARQFGGAIGVTALTVFLQAQLSMGLDSYRWAYGLSGLLALAAAVLAVRLPATRVAS